MAESTSRNSEIRKDVVFNKWVIFSPARARRPSDFKSHSPVNPNPQTSSNSYYSSSCPFCGGNERHCAPEIFRIPDTSSSSSDWKIRVIQNLYPALQRPENHTPNPSPNSNPIVLDGIGFHEVVIETPYHSLRLSDLSPSEIGAVLLAYKTRIQQLDDGSVNYVQEFQMISRLLSEISETWNCPREFLWCKSKVYLELWGKVFKNHGASAGASLSHSHSQLMGLPFVPPTVSARLDSMKEHFNRTGKCCLCEIWAVELLIDESSHFFSIVPFASSYPFEIWVVPREHSSSFHEIDIEKATDLGKLLKITLTKLSQQLNDPPFNFMIHTCPFQVTASQLSCAHWFLQIVPKLGVIGGFEIGSGCFINPVFPEDAAKVLREVNVTM